jgi:hypothetical protein
MLLLLLFHVKRFSLSAYQGGIDVRIYKLAAQGVSKDQMRKHWFVLMFNL